MHVLRQFVHDEYRVRAGELEWWLVSPTERLVRVELVHPEDFGRQQALAFIAEQPPSFPQPSTRRAHPSPRPLPHDYAGQPPRQCPLLRHRSDCGSSARPLPCSSPLLSSSLPTLRPWTAVRQSSSCLCVLLQRGPVTAAQVETAAWQAEPPASPCAPLLQLPSPQLQPCTPPLLAPSPLCLLTLNGGDGGYLQVEETPIQPSDVGAAATPAASHRAPSAMAIDRDAAGRAGSTSSSPLTHLLSFTAATAQQGQRPSPQLFPRRLPDAAPSSPRSADALSGAVTHCAVDTAEVAAPLTHEGEQRLLPVSADGSASGVHGAAPRAHDICSVPLSLASARHESAHELQLLSPPPLEEATLSSPTATAATAATEAHGSPPSSEATAPLRPQSPVSDARVAPMSCEGSQRPSSAAAGASLAAAGSFVSTSPRALVIPSCPPCYSAPTGRLLWPDSSSCAPPSPPLAFATFCFPTAQPQSLLPLPPQQRHERAAVATPCELWPSFDCSPYTPLCTAHPSWSGLGDLHTERMRGERRRGGQVRKQPHLQRLPLLQLAPACLRGSFVFAQRAAHLSAPAPLAPEPSAGPELPVTFFPSQRSHRQPTWAE